MNNIINDKKFNDIMNRIQSKRIELKLSYQDLANKTGLSKSTLQRYETGSIRNIPLDKLEILATALEVSPMWIIGYDDEVKSNQQSSDLNQTSLSKAEQQHIEDLRKLNDLGKNKVITYTKDLMDNPKFINISTDEMCATLNVAEENAPYLFAAHNDGIDEETNKANIEKIKALYDKMKK